MQTMQTMQNMQNMQNMQTVQNIQNMQNMQNMQTVQTSQTMQNMQNMRKIFPLQNMLFGQYDGPAVFGYSCKNQDIWIRIKYQLADLFIGNLVLL